MAHTTTHHDLQIIEELIVQMATFVEEAIARAIRAMTHGDEGLATTIIDADERVDALRQQVRRHVCTAIEHWALMGPALRRAIAYLLIGDELERIGDYAVHIASTAQVGYQRMPLDLLGEMGALAQQVRQQVRDGVNALAYSDVFLARQVCAHDAAIDQRYQALREAIQALMQETPDLVLVASQVLFAMHDLERSADRIANICENVIYLVTGVEEKLN